LEIAVHPDSSTPDGAALPPALNTPDTVEQLLYAYVAAQAAAAVWVRSVGIIDTTADRCWATVATSALGGVLVPVHLAAASLEPLNGYQFAWFGMLAPPTLASDPLLSWTFDLTSTTRLNVRFLRQCIWHGQSRIYGELLALPGAPEEQRLGGLEHPHKPAARQAAWVGLGKLREHMEQRAAGQKPLEAKPYHEWREKAARAEDLQRQYPGWSNTKIARQIGMLGREKTLGRWRERFRADSEN
jgi:hypothetical protein